MTVALASLAVSLLGVLIITTWRMAAFSTAMIEAAKRADQERAESAERSKALAAIPEMHARIGHLERTHSLIPRLSSRVAVVEAKAQFSQELRAQRASRPETED